MNDKGIALYYHQSAQIALDLVEKRARAILRQHPNLDEFIMGMGIWFFTRKVGTKDEKGIVIEEWMNNIVHEPLAYMKPVADLIDEWDEYLKITGEPMRFTANGPVVREW